MKAGMCEIGQPGNEVLQPEPAALPEEAGSVTATGSLAVTLARDTSDE